MLAKRLRSFILCLFVTQVWAAHAYAEGAVGVVFHGGIDSIQIWEPDGNGSARSGGEQQVTEDLFLTSDLRILPDGGYSIAQASGAGAMLLDALGSPTYLLDPELRYRDVSSVAVAGYLAGGQPARLAIADSFSSVVSIRDLGSGQAIWFQNMALVAGFADITEVVVLPQNRVAVAANYLPVGIHLIDVFDFSEGVISRTEFANFAHAESPEDVVVTPTLDGGVRSLFAGPGGEQLIVTGPFRVWAMHLDGTVDWELDLTQYPSIGGQVSDAKILDNGWVVFSMYEPGAWVEPSEDHRIYWYDPTTATIVATSPPLERAPVGIEIDGGHGGTGTLGFLAGVGEMNGNVEDLQVATFSLGGTSFDRGSLLRPEATIVNIGTLTIEVSGFQVLANAGECDAVVGLVVELLSQEESVGLFPSAALRLAQEVPVNDGFDPGPWCARLWVTDNEGVTTELAEPLGFEILEVTDNQNVDRTELRFEDLRESDTDMGEADMGTSDPPTDDGCGCSGLGGLPASPLAFFLLLGWRCRRRD